VASLDRFAFTSNPTCEKSLRECTIDCTLKKKEGHQTRAKRENHTVQEATKHAHVLSESLTKFGSSKQHGNRAKILELSKPYPVLPGPELI